MLIFFILDTIRSATMICKWSFRIQKLAVSMDPALLVLAIIIVGFIFIILFNIEGYDILKSIGLHQIRFKKISRIREVAESKQIVQIKYDWKILTS